MNSLYEQFLVALHAVWHRRWLALAIAWGVALVGWLVVALIPNSYESSARVYVSMQSLLPTQVGITQVDTYGPFTMPKRLDQYGTNDIGQQRGQPNADGCAAFSPVPAQSNVSVVEVTSTANFYPGDVVTYMDAQLRLVLPADALQYQVMVMPRQSCGVAVFSDERGVIYTGKGLGC